MRILLSFMVAVLWATCANGLVLEELIDNGQLEKTLSHQRVGYYIGSFDPLHKGHEKVASLCLENDLCNYVIVYPSWGGDTFKRRIDVQRRLDILFAVFEKHPTIIVTRFPPKKLQDTLTEPDVSKNGFVKPVFAGMSFIGIVGSDTALAVAKSEQALSTFMTGNLLTEMHYEHTVGGCMALPVESFFVVMREGDGIKSLEGKIGQKKMAAVVDAHSDEKGFSSTKAKKILSEGGSLESMLSEPVIDIIRKHHLYRDGSKQ
ncbi:MAG: hypothetical protein KBE16_08430 [Alphaproteobacteria bacterium]|jgi:nicotinic acid mononucleotide adenylyltransferase|nr:hypothetical protein [Alphaproteobacteria bacterium]MBP9877678.1 hypothetical protein [Alphaproteobacteria bacterium]